MKTKIATALSLVGILGAGTSAAMVNSQILDGGSAAAPASLLEPLEDTADPGVVSVGEPSTPTPLADGTATDAASSPGAPTVFEVGDAGTVTLGITQAQQLSIESALANSGWTVTKTEVDPTGTAVEIWFESATVQVKFEADLVGGQIVTSVDANTLAATPPGTDDDLDSDDDDHDSDDDDHDESDSDDDDHGSDDEHEHDRDDD